MRLCECLKKHVVHTMLSWWNDRSNRHGNQRGRRARSVSFKKYVDFIMYDKECLIAAPVSLCVWCVCVCVCVCMCACAHFIVYSTCGVHVNRCMESF